MTRLYQNYFVDVYGSHATGLCLHWSDIDLVVGPRANSDGEKEQPINATMQDARIKDALRRIADCLRGEMANQWITHVHYIDQATVPVVKIQCSLSALMASAGHKYPKNAKYAAIYDERFSLDISACPDDAFVRFGGYPAFSITCCSYKPRTTFFCPFSHCSWNWFFIIVVIWFESGSTGGLPNVLLGQSDGSPSFFKAPALFS